MGNKTIEMESFQFWFGIFVSCEKFMGREPNECGTHSTVLSYSFMSRVTSIMVVLIVTTSTHIYDINGWKTLRFTGLL